MTFTPRCFFLSALMSLSLSCGVMSPSYATSHIPEAVKKIALKSKDSQTVARQIAEQWKTVQKYSLTLDHQSRYTLVGIVEYLCPYCQKFLTGLSKAHFEKEKVNVALLYLPIFEGETSRAYGHVMQTIFMQNKEAFLENISGYPRHDLEALEQKMTKQSIMLDQETLKKFPLESEHLNLAQTLDVPIVPMVFLAVEQSEKEIIVIPLENAPSDQLIAWIQDIQKMDSASLASLKTSLGQDRK